MKQSPASIRERLSIIRYEHRAREERRKGLEYVRKRTRRLEEELGFQEGARR